MHHMIIVLNRKFSKFRLLWTTKKKKRNLKYFFGPLRVLPTGQNPIDDVIQ